MPPSLPKGVTTEPKVIPVRFEGPNAFNPIWNFSDLFSPKSLSFSSSVSSKLEEDSWDPAITNLDISQRERAKPVFFG